MSHMIANEFAKKYGPHMVEKAAEYVAFFLNEQPEDKKISNFREVVPTVAGLSLYLGISRDTVHAWRTSDEPEKLPFRDVVSDLMAVQEVLTLGGGLAGKFNARISTLVLSHHGYSEKIETNHTSSDGSMNVAQIQIVAPDVDPED